MQKQYVAFLRGINVGRNHKVPMAELKQVLSGAGYKNIITLLNSGNVIFESEDKPVFEHQQEITELLEQHFQFPIPTIVFSAMDIMDLHSSNPFDKVEVTESIRLLISFLSKDVDAGPVLPWISEDKASQILTKKGRVILSFMDLQYSNTPQSMKNVEIFYGKSITTRSWKTIEKIAAKL